MLNWIDINEIFSILLDTEDNTIDGIKLLNAYSVNTKDFIFLTAILRFFLNNSEIINKTVTFTSTKEDYFELTNSEGRKVKLLFDERFVLQFEIKIEENNRYLIVQTMKMIWNADSISNFNNHYVEYSGQLIEDDNGHYYAKNVKSYNRRYSCDTYVSNLDYEKYLNEDIEIEFTPKKYEITLFEAQLMLECLDKFPFKVRNNE